LWRHRIAGAGRAGAAARLAPDAAAAVPARLLDDAFAGVAARRPPAAVPALFLGQDRPWPDAPGAYLRPLGPAPIALEAEVGGLDIRHLPGNEIGHDAARAGGHGPAQRAVTGIEVEIAVARRPVEHGRAVRG